MAKRLVIAIDCDDVLVDSTKFLVEEYNRLYGTAVLLKDAHMTDNTQWEAESEEVHGRIDRIQLSDRYTSLVPTDETVKVIHTLATVYELHLITARAGVVAAVTQAMLDEYFTSCFTRVEHVGQTKTKGEVCAEIGADVLIDDNVKHLLSALEHGVASAVWFGDYAWQDGTVPSNIIRCRDWSAVLEHIDGI
jgi:5'(3')-deoxyribonucleotidase